MRGEAEKAAQAEALAKQQKPKKDDLLGITAETDPVKVEMELNPMVPAAERGEFSLRMILHGRRVCDAKKPRCEDCTLEDICPSSLLRAARPARRATTGAATRGAGRTKP